MVAVKALIALLLSGLGTCLSRPTRKRWASELRSLNSDERLARDLSELMAVEVCDAYRKGYLRALEDVERSVNHMRRRSMRGGGKDGDC